MRIGNTSDEIELREVSDGWEMWHVAKVMTWKRGIGSESLENGGIPDGKIMIHGDDDSFLDPGVFADRMREAAIRNKDDEEIAHVQMDGLMCELLKILGYGEAVEVFDETPKWYA